mmetsp:Transcript_8105/g.29911  ORF Transcript_8105/g.29911 Transcript_8105/m.29911 type:complete len:610 (+) Transcript_8105:85-1914(+)
MRLGLPLWLLLLPLLRPSAAAAAQVNVTRAQLEAFFHSDPGEAVASSVDTPSSAAGEHARAVTPTPPRRRRGRGAVPWHHYAVLVDKRLAATPRGPCADNHTDSGPADQARCWERQESEGVAALEATAEALARRQEMLDLLEYLTFHPAVLLQPQQQRPPDGVGAGSGSSSSSGSSEGGPPQLQLHDSVGVVMLTSNATSHRVHALRAGGWITRVRASRLAVVSAVADPTAGTVELPDEYLQTLSVTAARTRLLAKADGYWAGAYRKLAAVRFAHQQWQQQPPAAQPAWLLLCDDDTFVNVEQINKLVQRLNPAMPIIIGSKNVNRNAKWMQELQALGKFLADNEGGGLGVDDLPWSAFNTNPPHQPLPPQALVYLQGGSGVLMSRAALERIGPRLLSSDARCPNLVAEDATLGHCARNHGVALVHNALHFPNWAKSRFVPEPPRAQHGNRSVAEAEDGERKEHGPDPDTLACVVVKEFASGTLRCRTGGHHLQQLTFASFGTPMGQCKQGAASFKQTGCHAQHTANHITEFFPDCLGRPSCELFAHGALFGDPCVGTFKELKVLAECGPLSGSEVAAFHAVHYVHPQDQAPMQLWVEEEDKQRALLRL